MAVEMVVAQTHRNGATLTVWDFFLARTFRESAITAARDVLPILSKLSPAVATYRDFTILTKFPAEWFRFVILIVVRRSCGAADIFRTS